MADIRRDAKIETGMPVPSLVFLWQTVLRLPRGLWFVIYRLPNKLFYLPVTARLKWWPTSAPLIICIIALCWTVGGVGISLVWTLGSRLSQWLRIFLTFLFTSVLMLLVPWYLKYMRSEVTFYRKRDETLEGLRFL
jgi:hypothetical protein